MMEDPRNISFCAHLLFCSKNIERIGDRATNVAETVVYLITGDAMPSERPHVAGVRLLVAPEREPRAVGVLTIAPKRRTADNPFNSHQPFRRRERAMQRFRSMKTLQKFSSVHAQVHNYFNQERHLVTRRVYRFQLPERFRAIRSSAADRRCRGREAFGLRPPLGAQPQTQSPEAARLCGRSLMARHYAITRLRHDNGVSLVGFSSALRIATRTSGAPIACARSTRRTHRRNLQRRGVVEPVADHQGSPAFARQRRQARDLVRGFQPGRGLGDMSGGDRRDRDMRGGQGRRPLPRRTAGPGGGRLADLGQGPPVDR